ncbi:hypothetical protein B0H10DRAFT_1964610 [Mycena sp. CBHHK59/15]|nr:hypothetical protein B0H10DRAFT_1964610 [Mycena sp. CBHHK59/15]
MYRDGGMWRTSGATGRWCRKCGAADASLNIIGPTDDVVYSGGCRISDSVISGGRCSSAEFDTGAAFCYMNQDFVDKFYAFIPGFITRQAYENNPNRKIYYIPADFSEMPSVKFDLGGQMFTLEHLYLPGTTKYSRDGKGYHVGAIQSKTALFPDGSGDYNGPDVIGREGRELHRTIYEEEVTQREYESDIKKARDIMLHLEDYR